MPVKKKTKKTVKKMPAKKAVKASVKKSPAKKAVKKTKKVVRKTKVQAPVAVAPATDVMVSAVVDPTGVVTMNPVLDK